MTSFQTIPSEAKSLPRKFHVDIPDKDIKEFYQLLRLSKLAPETYENRQTDGNYGLNREWLINAKSEWENWDWYAEQLHHWGSSF
jgi:microsomal epoxide hydrolase